jgi:hypothetical protein
MIKAYINYPNPHITAHFDLNCGNIKAQHKTNQRNIRINIITITQELQNFRDKKYTFAANPEHNDMWLEIDFHNREFELAVLNYVCHLIGRHYRPLAGIRPNIHC